MTTATDLLDMLDAHHAAPPSRPQAGVMVREIQAPHSLRRADALWLPITSGGRGQIIGHEVKVSRSDLLAELRDPHKADSWQPLCDRWWLVLSEDFTEGLDIPPEWGIMLPPKRGRFMQVLRKAPVLQPDIRLSRRAWGTVFARVAYADGAEMRALEAAKRDAADWKQKWNEVAQENRRLSRIAGAEVEGGYGRITRTVAEVLNEMEKQGGWGNDADPALRWTASHVEAAEIARVILLANKVGEVRQSIGRELDYLDTSLRNTTESVTNLRRAFSQNDTQGG